MRILLIWLKNWIKYPLVLGAILPTQKFASNIMTSEIDNSSKLVVELGSGTGGITNSIVDKEIDGNEIVLVEINKEFCKILELKFPKAKIFCEDAITFFEKFPKRFNREIDIIISAIPLVSLDKKSKEKICDLSVKNLKEKGKFFQITYFIRCPFPKNLIVKHKLKKELKGFTLFNVPPAFIWKLSK